MSEKCFTIAMALAVIASFAASASAVPTAYHNPATGSLRIVSDLEILPALYVLSASQRFVVTPESYLPVPGAFFNVADTPYGITYLNFRAGDYPIGNVIEPGTPCSDLTLGYYYGEGPPFTSAVVCVPEPATFSMVGCGLLGVAMMRQRLRTSRRRTSAACNIGHRLR